MASEDDSVAPASSDDSEPFNVVGGGDGRGDFNFKAPTTHYFDVEGYAVYRGRTMISRLLFIAERCSDPESHKDALRLAYMKIKRTGDTQLHRRVVQMINGRLGPEYGLDQAWIDDVDRRMAHGKDELQKDVSDAQYCLYEESIRRAFADFGDFYYSHGHLADAFEKYVQSCDYCTTEDDTIQMYLRVILVSIELGQFSYVSHYADKAMKASCSLSPLTVGKLLCASGLAYLHGKEYKLAACKFVEMRPALGISYTEVVTPLDIGTYGGLCALASFDRTELENKVIDNGVFQNYLEFVPEVRELIIDFHERRYIPLLERFKKLKSDWLLDIHLYSHIDKLYTLIRLNAMVHYTLPFCTIRLSTMADAFNTSVSELEKDLVALITDNQIQARIDSQNKTLHVRHDENQRNATFRSVRETGKGFIRDVNAMLCRASLLKHEHN